MDAAADCKAITQAGLGFQDDLKLLFDLEVAGNWPEAAAASERLRPYLDRLSAGAAPPWRARAERAMCEAFGRAKLHEPCAVHCRQAVALAERAEEEGGEKIPLEALGEAHYRRTICLIALGNEAEASHAALE